MCGIAGFVVASRDVGRHDTAACLARSLARRGPDGEGIQVWDRATLVHRRLAIFDLSSAGCQPMLSDDRRVGIVFNGAIYNWPDLRRELERLGYRFHSQTDTEVLLHGYSAWGIDELVRRIRGMFAFAVWDDGMERLFLVRDRLGVKPLVYVNDGRVLTFASTPRALHDAGLGRDLDELAVAEFLEYGYVGEDRSIYRDVRKVPPATILEFRDGAVSGRTYWQPPVAGSRADSFPDAVEQTQSLFLDAVRGRLQADVPVGALLSGGIDSALVCWGIRTLGADITAYTVSTPDASVDETADAVATAKTLGLRHELLPMRGFDPSIVDDLVAAYPEPFACASALGMLRVSRAIADSDIKVVLTGDGGDDVFLGYARHRMMARIEHIARRVPGFATNVWRAARRALPRRGLVNRTAHAVDYTVGGLGAFLSATPGLPALRVSRVLGPRLRDAVVRARTIPWHVGSARQLLGEYLEYDRHHQFVSEYLAKVDGATMHYALEARSPFLDTDLWEYAAGLRADVRLHGGELKAILRMLARRNISAHVASGTKRGFSIPVEQWVAGPWSDRARELFDNSLMEANGWIDGGAALGELELARRTGVASTQLWYLFVLETWLRRQRDDTTPGVRESASARAF